MHKDRIAERLLALVTDQDRAASTVGDLMEHARVRGALWYWSSVLRTMTALTWRSFAAEPRKFIWGGLRGSLRAMLFEILAECAAVFGFMLAALLVHSLFGPPGPQNWSQILRGWVLWPYYAAIWGAPAFALYRVGRWVARRTPGEELTAGLAFFVIQCILSAFLAIPFLLLDAHGIKTPSGQSWFPAMGQFSWAASNSGAFFLTLAGAMSARKHAAVR